MRFILLSVSLSLFVSPLFATPSVLGELSSLRWQNRLILVIGVSDIQGSRQEFDQFSDAIIERDIIWFIFDQSDVITNYQGKVNPSFKSQIKAWSGKEKQSVVLIGKDGDVKSVSSSLELQKLFALIDGMPMRQ